MALERAPFGNLHLNPFALDGIGVFNGDVRVIQRDGTDLLTLFFSLIQPLGNQGSGLFIEHSDSCGCVFSLSLWERAGVRASGRRDLPLTLTLSPKGRGD